MSAFGWVCLGVCFLALGRRFYLLRWPEGLWPPEDEQELERIRRVGRRRVLPLPPRVAGGQGHQHPGARQ